MPVLKTLALPLLALYQVATMVLARSAVLGYSRWWSATAYNTTYRYFLGYDSSEDLKPRRNGIGRIL